MRNILISAAVLLSSMIASGAALAGATVAVPEPVSMSLLVGGIAVIVAVRQLRHK